MTIIEDLKKRNIFKAITNIEKFTSLKPQSGVYIGFDPSAPSLHLGNYIQIATLLRFKQYGFTPIAVIGGATGMIGDPSGKNQERVLLDEKTLAHNKQKISQQLTNFKIKVVDNLQFYQQMSLITFLRDVGKHMNINYMTNKETVAKRLATGISFTEFSYQLLQGYDFVNLYQNHNVFIQVGGSDQWGNITTGIELIRKIIGENNQAVGITTKLLVAASGKKFGKSEGNAIWLDQSQTSPFTLYQYLINTADDDVANIMRWLTFLPNNKIDQIIKSHEQNTAAKQAQKQLAFAVTQDIHGIDAAQQAVAISSVLFENASFDKLTKQDLLSLQSSLPTTTCPTKDLQSLLVAIEATSSKRQARTLIASGAIVVNGQKITNDDFQVTQEVNLIKKGKRNFYLAIIQDGNKKSH